MIHIPQVDPNISITAQLGVINSQFYRFLRLSSSEFCIQVVTSGVLKGYVQGAGRPNHYPIYRPLCLSGIDACIYRDMLKSSFL